MTVKLLRLTVLSVEPGFATVEVPDAGSLRVPCPDQFTPEVGQSVLLSLVGPVPQQIIPEQIAVDAITAREIKAGSIEAEHITATAIDGMVITGSTLRTAATGERFVVNEAGTTPNEIRLYGTTGTNFGSFAVTTANALPVATLTGFKVDGKAGQVDLRSDAAAVFYGSDVTTPEAHVFLHPLSAQMGVTAARRVLITVTDLEIKHGSAVRVVAPTVAFTGRPGFNGATPPVVPTLPAAATDLASVITLANSLRQALIDYGLAT